MKDIFQQINPSENFEGIESNSQIQAKASDKLIFPDPRQLSNKDSLEQTRAINKIGDPPMDRLGLEKQQLGEELEDFTDQGTPKIQIVFSAEEIALALAEQVENNNQIKIDPTSKTQIITDIKNSLNHNSPQYRIDFLKVGDIEQQNAFILLPGGLNSMKEYYKMGDPSFSTLAETRGRGLEHFQTFTTYTLLHELGHSGIQKVKKELREGIDEATQSAIFEKLADGYSLLRMVSSGIISADLNFVDDVINQRDGNAAKDPIHATGGFIRVLKENNIFAHYANNRREPLGHEEALAHSLDYLKQAYASLGKNFFK